MAKFSVVVHESFGTAVAFLVSEQLALLLPKIVMQIMTLFMRLLIRQAFVAMGTVTTSALEEGTGAGALLVSALEEALDLPAAISSTPSPGPAPARLAGQAASAAIGNFVGNASATDFGPAVELAVTQSLLAHRAEQTAPRKGFLPGWLLVLVGGIGSRFL